MRVASKTDAERDAQIIQVNGKLYAIAKAQFNKNCPAVANAAPSSVVRYPSRYQVLSQNLAVLGQHLGRPERSVGRARRWRLLEPERRSRGLKCANDANNDQRTGTRRSQRQLSQVFANWPAGRQE